MKKRNLIFSLMIFIIFMLEIIINTGKVDSWYNGYFHDVDSLSKVSVDEALSYDWDDDKDKINYI